jgi:hypothetical protein
VGIVIGDVSGHGSEALSSTTLVRHTVRAYMEGGLAPRHALKLSSAVLSDALGERLVTVLAAVHDPSRSTLTYASAGHPHPIFTGPAAHEPVTAMSSPPLGLDLPAGTRQTTVPFPATSRALFHTDGVTDAPTRDGRLGRDGLARGVSALDPDADAAAVLRWVEQHVTRVRDDMAAVVATAAVGDPVIAQVTEEIEIGEREIATGELERFLRASGVPDDQLSQAHADAKSAATASGVAVVRVTSGSRDTRVDVVPGELEAVAPHVRS